MRKDIIWFKDLTIDDVSLVGGKNAALGEMYSELVKVGIKIPNGFAITAQAYKYFLEFNKFDKKIEDILKGLNTHNTRDLAQRGKKIRELIKNGIMPQDLEEKIKNEYQKLSNFYKTKNVDVAVRSSATAEDLPDASFAGQQETYLNIRGEKELIEAVKNSFSSLFTDRAISYRYDKGFSSTEVLLSVGVQKMVRSDKGSSGVAFTIDTETGFNKVIIINGSYGLGELIVKGQVTPDEFIVFKPSLENDFYPIISKNIGEKEIKMIYSRNSQRVQQTETIKTPILEQQKFCLTDEEVIKLSKDCLKIEKHFSKKHKRYSPMDIEWAKDGITGEMFIVQARPETVQALKNPNIYEEYILKQKGKLLLTGIAIGTKISAGKVRVIKDVKQISEFQKGEILVTEVTDPDWEPIMKIASGIITDKGGRTCFSGETKILTDKGFLEFRELFQRWNQGERFLVYSYDYDKKQPVWKKVLGVQSNKLSAVRVNVSQTGRMKDNFLDVTLDHKFYTYQDRKLIKKPLKEILNNQEGVCLTDKLPALTTNSIDSKLAYLLGAWAADGNIYFNKGINGLRRGQLVFTQKQTLEKQEFISEINRSFAQIFNKTLTFRKKNSVSQLNGRTIVGVVTDFRASSLSIAFKMSQYLQNLPLLALSFSEVAAKHFLAGVIDGDGSFYNNRIQIYVSKKNVFQAIIISCLRLGIVPQVTTNRNIYNVQIVEKIQEILTITKRVKGPTKEKTLGTKLFFAKQVLNDILDKVNYQGKIRPYVKSNLLIDSRKIKNNILPLVDINLKKELEQMLRSNLRMQRISFNKNLGKIEVFNLEVEANKDLDRNYVVFTKRLTPLLVSNSHAAIVSRELGVNCIVGAGNATSVLKTGQNITMDCSSGTIGNVYEGRLNFEVKRHELKKLKNPKVKISINIGSPDEAFRYHNLPVKGVGLGRLEFIIASQIQIHPNALIDYEKIKKGDLKFNNQTKRDLEKLIKKIDQLTIGYKNKQDFYVDKLTFGIAKIAAAFWPNEVIIRFSDFKTNEYATLAGGNLYEPFEENPMIGWRGASRYYNPNFEKAFGLECQAIKNVREKLGLINVVPMVPFCRTIEEAQKVLKIMAEYGLKRGKLISGSNKSPLKVYVMAEIPSNAILAKDFLKYFDGMSIGSNDLTQLVLGIDRDSAIISGIGNENNQAVKETIEEIIKECRKQKKYSGICGQAPSDFPQFAKFLQKIGIEAISLNPDSIIKTIIALTD